MVDSDKARADYWHKVEEGLSGNTGSNESCDYYPCHHEGQDCTLCFCPFYPCLDDRLGTFVESRSGGQVWSCQDCLWIHRPDVGRAAKARLSGRGRPSHEELLAIKDELERSFKVKAERLMVMGATSGAGKTLMVAAICRILADKGMRVAPFKSQNMSLNSTVTPRGEEISRAQALQAQACRVEPEARMNPLLLKPKKDDISQVVVLGRPYKDMSVGAYYGGFTTGEGARVVREAFHHLELRFDAIVIEGAGSPAEINLAEADLANMLTAEITDSPCILVVNIEWGGAFAYAYGTLMLLPPEQRSRFKGVIINNMHGSAESVQKGIDELERLTGVPVLGVVPHIEHALPDEDSQGLEGRGNGGIKVGVIRLPHISNFTDFDALEIGGGASVSFIDSPSEVAAVDALVIPGTKSTVADLQWLRRQRLDRAIMDRRGEVPILGICGGYQMLGTRIEDPNGVEVDEGGSYEGLGLLRSVSRFDAYEKRTVRVEGRLLDGGEIRGYEIHMGTTETEEKPLFVLRSEEGERDEGSVSEDGMVMGTYVHGLFDLPSFRSRFLSLAGKGRESAEQIDYESAVEAGIAKVARIVSEHIDVDRLMRIMEEGA
ncbi:MAG: cobyric acid synthase [Methanomassiliicoccaceae archaeon]|jgi:adenosylcobyric acid synthase